MKKSLILLLALLMLAVAFLAACGGDEKEESTEPEISLESAEPSDSGDTSDSASEAASDAASDDVSDTSEESSVSDSSDESTPPVEEAISVYTCRYTADPYYVIVGQCADGAIISGTANGKTEQSKSHKGWFILRLNSDTAGTEVTLEQTVGGEKVGAPLIYSASPEKPGSDMWGIIAGTDFQMFLEKSADDFVGSNIPASSAYSTLESRVVGKLNQLKSYKPDAEIIYMIVPSAMTVYPELVPEEYTPASTTKLDKTLETLKKAGATVIDLKSAFEKHKNDEMPLYYKTDSHWSDYGAFVAYTELFNHISKKFPAARPLSVDAFDWKGDYYQGGDIAYYLAKDKTEALKFQNEIREYAYYRTFKDSIPADIKNTPRYQSADKLSYSNDVTYNRTFNTYEDDRPNCIVMRDSFSTQIYDLIAERSNLSHFYGMWDYTWNISNIRNDGADYIIYVVAEWNIDDILYYS